MCLLKYFFNIYKSKDTPLGYMPMQINKMAFSRTFICVKIAKKKERDLKETTIKLRSI